MERTIIPTLSAGDVAARCTVFLLTSDPRSPRREELVRATGGSVVQICTDVAALNAAVRAASTHYCLIWSDLLAPTEGLLPRLVGRLEADAACVGVSPVWTYDLDGRQVNAMAGMAVTSSGGLRPLYEGRDAASAAVRGVRRCVLAPVQSLLLRREAFVALGGLSEQLDALLAGPDLCLRLATQYSRQGGGAAFFAVEPEARADLRDILLPLKLVGLWNSLVSRGRLACPAAGDLHTHCAADGLSFGVNRWLTDGPTDQLEPVVDESAPWQESYFAWRASGDASLLARSLASAPTEERENLLELCRSLPDCLPYTAAWYAARAEKLRAFAEQHGLEAMKEALGAWDAAAFRTDCLVPAMQALRRQDVYEASLEACPGTYDAWLELEEEPRRAAAAGKAPAAVGRAPAVETGAARPRLSVIMPVWNTEPTFLRAAVDSVLGQTYADWQLCLVDDASDRQETRELLDSLKTADPRIRFARQERNGGIARASQAALELADAPWTALLDHDDMLAPDALAQVADAVAAQPHWRYLFSDEDKMDAAGVRRNPFFKPGFDRDLLEGGNYACHLSAFARDTLLECGGFREGFDGAQDFDLILRVTDALEDRQIGHIPSILYHWRVHPGSCAGQVGAKKGVEEASRRALADHLSRCGRGDEICGAGMNNFFRLGRPLPEKAPQASVVLLARPGVTVSPVLRQTLEELAALWPCEILWQPVDISIDEPSLAPFADWKALPPATNWAGGCNAAVRAASGELVLFLDAALVPLPGCRPEQLLIQAMRDDVAVVGGVIYRDGGLWNAGLVPGASGLPFAFMRGLQVDLMRHVAWGQLMLTRSCIAAPMECMAFRRDLYLDRNGFNVNFGTLSGADFCLGAARRRLKTLASPWAQWGLPGEHAEDALAVRTQIAIQEGSGTQCGTLRAAETRESYIAYQQILQRFKDRWGDDIRRSPVRNRQLGAAFDNGWRLPL